MDTARGRVGVARAWDGGRLTLREPGGDELWETRAYRRPTATEEMRPLVKEENRRSRTWRGVTGE